MLTSFYLSLRREVLPYGIPPRIPFLRSPFFSPQLSGAGYSSCVSFGLCSSLESCKLNRAKRLLQAMLNERIVSLGGTLRLSPLACLTTRKLSVLWLKLRQAYQAGRTTTAPKPANGGPKCAISAARDGATVSVR